MPSARDMARNQAIQKLWSQGATVAQLADATGMSTTGLRRIVTLGGAK